MKAIRQIILGLTIALGVFGIVLYTACQKDACKSVVCHNQGTCRGGQCSCPTGIGGVNCETVYLYKDSGTYQGYAMRGSVLDTTLTTLVFSAAKDSNYTAVKITWNDSAVNTLFATFNASIDSTRATSSVATVIISDSTGYSGHGSFDGTSASLSLTHNNGGTKESVVFNNFIRR